MKIALLCAASMAVVSSLSHAEYVGIPKMLWEKDKRVLSSK